MTKETDIVAAANHIRENVIKMTYAAGKKGAHIGGALSMCEILAVLYMAVMKIDINDIGNPERDRFILSKGHGAIALYAALKEKGILSQKDLDFFKVNGSDFWTHPRFLPQKGFEFSSGSLGQGLSLAAGTALALRLRQSKAHIYVYIGDGECDEGAVWEAASFVAHHKLNNITVIVDENKLQLDAATKDIINKYDLDKRWKAFGFDIIKPDGHSIPALLKAFKYSSEKPVAILAQTIKGKGVSFIENNPIYHMNFLTKDQFEQAMNEQEEK